MEITFSFSEDGARPSCLEIRPKANHFLLVPPGEKGPRPQLWLVCPRESAEMLALIGAGMLTCAVFPTVYVLEASIAVIFRFQTPPDILTDLLDQEGLATIGEHAAGQPVDVVSGIELFDAPEGIAPFREILQAGDGILDFVIAAGRKKPRPLWQTTLLGAELTFEPPRPTN